METFDCGVRTEAGRLGGHPGQAINLTGRYHSLSVAVLEQQPPVAGPLRAGPRSRDGWTRTYLTGVRHPRASVEGPKARPGVNGALTRDRRGALPLRYYLAMVIPGLRPKLFIGSSSERAFLSSEFFRISSRAAAQVTPWTDRSIFKPLQFYAQDLLEVPHRFDFGLFFVRTGRHCRGAGVSNTRVPRDNVIFELGLFMSRLGLTRAFAVAPRGRVKILSDVAGLKLVEYDMPVGLPELRDSLKSANWSARQALEEAIRRETGTGTCASS